MAESLEEVSSRGSILPLAMFGAFVIGAAIAGWFVFGEEIRQWSRLESVAWEITPGETLSLVEEHRVRRTLSDQGDTVVTTTLYWTLTPESGATLPGAEALWTQSLDGGVLEYVAPDGTVTSRDIAPVTDRVAPVEDMPDAPTWAPMLPYLQGLGLVSLVNPDATTAVSATAPEMLEEIETRRTGRPMERRRPLDEEALATLHENIRPILQNTVAGLGAPIHVDPYRPGQAYTRELEIPVGEWGFHGVRVEQRMQRYEGDMAIIEGQVSRRPGDAALTATDDGLSGLKGTSSFRFDCAADRPAAGHLRVEARGKIDRKFATLVIEHAYALAPVGQPLQIPPAYALELLPPPAAVEGGSEANAGTAGE